MPPHLHCGQHLPSDYGSITTVVALLGYFAACAVRVGGIGSTELEDRRRVHQDRGIYTFLPPYSLEIPLTWVATLRRSTYKLQDESSAGPVSQSARLSFTTSTRK